MPMLVLVVLVAFASRLCAGVDHLQNVGSFVRLHSDTLSKELGKRVSKTSTSRHSNGISLQTTYSSTGYLYLTNSFSADCSNVAASYGNPVNTCIVADNFAYKIQVVDDTCVGAVIEYYSDEECTALIDTAAIDTDLDLTCQETLLNIVSNPAIGGKVYAQLHCTNAAAPPRNSDLGGGVLEFFENSTSCDSTRESIFLSYTSNVCITGGDHAYSVDCSDGSVRFTIDNDKVQNCRGQLGQIKFPNTCELGDDPQDDDDITDDAGFGTSSSLAFVPPTPFASNSSFNSTNALPMLSQRATCQASLVPTVTPTTAPSSTAYPTSSVKRWISFRASQIITGLDLFTYEQDEEAHSYTLKQTLAQVMSGLSMDDIVEVAITDVPASARTSSAAKTATPQAAHTSMGAAKSAHDDRQVLNAAPHHGAAHLRALQTTTSSSAVKASFKVLSYSAYNARQLVTQLQQSLVSGEFTTLLQSNAYSNSASGFETASSSSLDSNDAYGGGHETVLTVGDIIGIAIAGLVVMLLMAYVIYVLCGPPKE
eukprot:gene18563-21127_t